MNPSCRKSRAPALSSAAEPRDNNAPVFGHFSGKPGVLALDSGIAVADNK